MSRQNTILCVWLVVAFAAMQCGAQDAHALLNRVLEEEPRQEFEEARKGESAMATKYGASDTTYQPKMYTFIADSGVLFSLVYACHYRRAGAVRNRIGKRILEEFAKDPRIQLAYPTHREIRTFAPPQAR